MIQKLKRSRAGFTLVELIVVIAILAILAGVAIPVYSNYIQKANEAGDLQLLSAVNTAWAAACVGNGIDAATIENATLNVDEAHRIVGIDTVVPSELQSELNRDFLYYFGDNVNTALKYYSSASDFRFEDGVFVTNSGGNQSYVYKGKTLTVNEADVTAFQASTYSEVGMDTLMDEVDYVTKAAKDAITGMTGASIVARGKEEGSTYHDIYSFLNSLGFTDSEIENLSQQELTNSFVLLAAHSMPEFDVDACIESFKENGSISWPGSGVGGGMPDMIASLSFSYALAMGFVNSGYASQEQIAAYENRTLNSSMDVYYLLEGIMYNPDYSINENFYNYMCEQGGADMSGYISTMRMVDSNISNLDVKELIQNGYTDPDLVNILKTILGD